MWHSSFASSKRLGLITVAVNRSPTRAFLLDNVSLILTFRSVPIGTKGVTAGLVVRFLTVDRRSLGLVVCAVTNIGLYKSAAIVRATSNLILRFTFIVPP